MARTPITIEGNLTDAPQLERTDEGRPYARFTVAVNDRRYNEEAKRWEDGDTFFHRATVFGRQAENAAASLQKGDAVIVAGSLQFQNWEDEEGRTRTGTQILADHIGPSLRYNAASVIRTRRQAGPDAETTGPDAPAPETGSPTLAY